METRTSSTTGTFVTKAFWGDETIPRGGGLAVILDGWYIDVRNNYIHDFYQKGVEIRGGRYVLVEGNIIKGIATTSLSGGHGIMRQQKGREYFTDDFESLYRWDIKDNLIFNVEQRIYSWVPSKGFIEMVIDEGKSILIDDPKDSDGVQERMSARITNNVIAFGAVDHIRLKSTPNLEVSNNSIYSTGAGSDGITDKAGDTETPLFTNFIFKNNLAHVPEDRFALEADDAIEQADTADGSAVGEILNNYGIGRVKPTTRNYDSRPEITNNITDMDKPALFVDPENGDFRIVNGLDLPDGVGVSEATLDDLDDKADNFGITVQWDGWVTDNLKLTQSILDNIPNLLDGVEGNETVFADMGEINAEHDEITFQVVRGDWKTNTRSKNRQKFELNPLYEEWYHEAASAHLNADGEEYERIRWGDSEVRQDQVFDDDWLTYTEITEDSSRVINGNDVSLTVDGDLLIHFADGFIPEEGQSWDIITAGTITSANTGDLFDRVIFEGYEPTDFSLEIVPLTSPRGGSASTQALRFTAGEALPVELLSFAGERLPKGQHRLRWATTREVDNDFFELQRSAAGSEWEVLTTISGAGDTEGLTAYDYTDETPLAGSNLYRLRQVDYDGAFTYSDVVELTSTGDSQALAPFPNPFTETFAVSYSGPIKEFAVRSADGRQLMKGVTYRVEGLRLLVRAGHLPAGAYIVRYNERTSLVIKR